MTKIEPYLMNYELCLTKLGNCDKRLIVTYLGTIHNPGETDLVNHGVDIFVCKYAICIMKILFSF